MEGLSNQKVNGNAPGSNVELTLMGIEKKWVRHNGSWVDKTTIPVEPQKLQETHLVSDEIEGSISPWWQFWRA